MPQEHQVLRCYSCKKFQVHIVRKDKKWQCKVCNSKQSLMKVYGRGSGKDCRLHVMKLNEIQFSQSSSAIPECIADIPCASNVLETTKQSILNTVSSYSNQSKKTCSKWSAYTEEKRVPEEDEECEIKYKIIQKESINRKKKRTVEDSSTPVKNNKKSRFTEKSFEMFEDFEDKDYDLDLNRFYEELKVEKKKETPVHAINCAKNKSKWSAYLSTEQELGGDKEVKPNVLNSAERQVENTNDNVEHKMNMNGQKIQGLDVCKENIVFEQCAVLCEEKFQHPKDEAKCDTLNIFNNCDKEDDLDQILNF